MPRGLREAPFFDIPGFGAIKPQAPALTNLEVERVLAEPLEIAWCVVLVKALVACPFDGSIAFDC